MFVRRLTVLIACLASALLLSRAQADEPPGRLTSRHLDVLLVKEGVSAGPLVGDETFLGRASLDLLGRRPTADEIKAFATDASSDKGSRAIERLLANPEFGQHWANYWTDTISYKVPPPELTFLSYTTFKNWLATQLNKNVGWDQITRELLSASGPITKNPAVTFIGYHQGRPAKLAAETARIFLGLQLQCAECHDHKFDVWKREQFHALAAFFGRVSGKLGKAQDGSSTEVGDLGKGEYVMVDVKDPSKKPMTMAPAFLSNESLKLGASDKERRDTLARLVTERSNPWFAKAYVNRLWARLMGRGFHEPVDNLGDYVEPLLTDVHEKLARHFAANAFDVQDLFRLVMNTEAYQRQTTVGRAMAKKANTYGKAPHTKLNGDEVFRALVTALGLPNLTPPAMKPTAEIRFPPPPKSTRDVVAEKFGFDPSLCSEEVQRTMGQAMLLMNNKQIQTQINADPKSGTMLSKLLAAEKDDRVAIVRLFYQVLARQPTEAEIAIALDHLREVDRRGPAFEDILWGLINGAEFTTRR